MTNRLIREDDDAPEEVRAPVAPVREALPPAPSPRKRGRGPYPGKRQVTAHIDENLFKWLRSMSVQTDKPMVVMFEEALTAYVQRFAAGKKFSGTQ